MNRFIAVTAILLSSFLVLTRADAIWVQDGGSLNLNTSCDGNTPSIALLNDTVYVAWTEPAASGMPEQLYIKYFSNSVWFQDGLSLNVNTGQPAYAPHLVFKGQMPYIAWSEFNGTANQVYVKHRTGTGWVQDSGSLNTVTTFNAYNPMLAIVNQTPFIAWEEDTGAASEVWVKLLNAGDWDPVGPGSLNVDPSQWVSQPSMVALNGTPYVAWHEYNGVAQQIYVKHFNGSNWQQDGGTLNVASAWDAFEPSIAIVRGEPYVAWCEHFNPMDQHLFVKHLSGASWVQDGGVLNVDGNQNAYAASMASVNGVPYVMWLEFTPAGANQLYVKHLNGGTWVQNGGSVNVNGNHTASDPSIASLGDIPYVSWTEYNGTAGNPGVAGQVQVKHDATPTITPTSVLPPAIGSTVSYAAPNPFKASRGQRTQFYFTPDPSGYSIRILTLRARIVRTLQNSDQWDGRDDNGQACESGVYVYQIKNGSKYLNGTVVLFQK